MKSTSIRRILVPFDLKEESKIALHHAVFLASASKAQITLLHVIASELPAPQKVEIMESAVSEIRATYAGEVNYLFEMGDLVETVGVVGLRESCDLIVMPTHGLRGWQHVSGSLALRIISETSIPCLVVQQREVRKEGFKKIVVPIHWRNQILEEIPIIIQMAKQFGGEVHLIAPPKEDDFEDNTLLEKVRDEFGRNQVPFSYTEENDLIHFANKVVRYAASIDADLICSINFSYEYLYTLIPRAEEEELIYNVAEIPVLLLTPLFQDNQVYIVPFWH
jgi:nucleotide-binding universal stress UspA family protein